MQHARQYVQYLTEKEQERHDAMVKAEKQLEQFRLQQDDLKRKALEVGFLLTQYARCDSSVVRAHCQAKQSKYVCKSTIMIESPSPNQGSLTSL